MIYMIQNEQIMVADVWIITMPFGKLVYMAMYNFYLFSFIITTLSNKKWWTNGNEWYTLFCKNKASTSI